MILFVSFLASRADIVDRDDITDKTFLHIEFECSG